MTILTIPRKIAKHDDLVVIPRKEYEALLEYQRRVGLSDEDRILRLSQESRQLKRAGRLPLFKNFVAREYPGATRRYWRKKQK